MMGGLVVVVAGTLLMAAVAPWISPYASDRPTTVFSSPWQNGGSWAHPLAIDKAIGRDILSRLIWNAAVIDHWLGRLLHCR